MELSLPASPSRLAGLRRAAWADLRGVSDEVADDVVLALNEVATNAVLYGSSGGQPIQVLVHVHRLPCAARTDTGPDARCAASALSLDGFGEQRDLLEARGARDQDQLVAAALLEGRSRERDQVVVPNVLKPASSARLAHSTSALPSAPGTVRPRRIRQLIT